MISWKDPKHSDLSIHGNALSIKEPVICEDMFLFYREISGYFRNDSKLK